MVHCFKIKKKNNTFSVILVFTEIIVHSFNSPPITMRVDDVSSLTANASKMVEMLSEENKNLREEINIYSSRVSKLQKVMSLLCQCLKKITDEFIFALSKIIILN